MRTHTAIAIGLSLILSACATAPPKPWVERTHSEIDCTLAIRDLLRDPGSYQMTEMRIKKDDADPEAGQAIIQFRAKNGFGGYASGAALCERAKVGDGYQVTATLLGQ